jgi:DNA polymerase-3 subunit beta
MKFTLTRSTALTVLKQALKTCNTKAKGQADSEFLFKPDDNALLVTSLNETSEQNIVLQCSDLEFEQGESFSVSGQALVEFLQQFPEEEVKCLYNPDDSSFVIGSKKTRFAFPTGSGSDFVPFNFQSHGKAIELPSSSLREVLKSTAFAASHDYTQAPLTAVHLKIADDEIVAEACDTLRISRHVTQVSSLSDEAELLLPYETAENLVSLIEDVGDITIQPGQRHVRFAWGDTTFTSTLENTIGKPYPELSKFMQGKEIGRVKISKGNLSTSLKLAGLVAKDSYVNVVIKPLDKDGLGGGLVISANEQAGMSLDTLIVQEQSGEAEVNVAHRFFSKAVDFVNNPWVIISFRELKENTIALVLVDGGFEHLIFPVTPNATPDVEDEESED